MKCSSVNCRMPVSILWSRQICWRMWWTIWRLFLDISLHDSYSFLSSACPGWMANSSASFSTSSSSLLDWLVHRCYILWKDLCIAGSTMCWWNPACIKSAATGVAPTHLSSFIAAKLFNCSKLTHPAEHIPREPFPTTRQKIKASWPSTRPRRQPQPTFSQ